MKKQRQRRRRLNWKQRRALEGAFAMTHWQRPWWSFPVVPVVSMW